MSTALLQDPAKYGTGTLTGDFRVMKGCIGWWAYLGYVGSYGVMRLYGVT